MATTLYLLEPSLEKMGAPVAKRIRYELKRRVYTPYLTERFEWMGNGKDRLNNWTPWCTQNVLLSAFLVSGCEDRRKEILEKACRSVDYFLDEYGDDGCCDEGRNIIITQDFAWGLFRSCAMRSRRALLKELRRRQKSEIWRTISSRFMWMIFIM